MGMLIFSDIHGDERAGQLLKKAIERFKPDRIIILGDILHGADEGCTSLLSLLRKYSNIITAVRGNCDYESDSEDLLFGLPLYAGVVYENHACHLSHHPQYAVSFPPGDVVMSGHTHIKVLEKDKGVVYLNPGSCVFPRDECTSFAYWDDGVITLYSLDGLEPLKSLNL